MSSDGSWTRLYRRCESTNLFCFEKLTFGAKPPGTEPTFVVLLSSGSPRGPGWGAGGQGGGEEGGRQRVAGCPAGEPPGGGLARPWLWVIKSRNDVDRGAGVKEL